MSYAYSLALESELFRLCQILSGCFDLLPERSASMKKLSVIQKVLTLNCPTPKAQPTRKARQTLRWPRTTNCVEKATGTATSIEIGRRLIIVKPPAVKARPIRKGNPKPPSSKADIRKATVYAEFLRELHQGAMSKRPTPLITNTSAILKAGQCAEPM